MQASLKIIGAAILPIETTDGVMVSIKGMDCLNGAHLLDIKPAILHEERKLPSRNQC